MFEGKKNCGEKFNRLVHWAELFASLDRLDRLVH